jgi:transcription elongation factor GreA
MPENPVPLTPEGKARLASELEGLRGERKAVSERIHNARELGSSQADAEYDDAKIEQGRIEGRILEIEDILRRAVLIDEKQAHHAARVVVGSGVKVEQDGVERHFQIVGPPEADVAKGRIPNDSPVASALLGKKVGDVVEVNAPRGVTKIKLLAID